MKKSYKISINNPCSENWRNFVPKANGGFCNSCKKNVADFTKMTDVEIINLLRLSADTTCGRLSHTQVKKIYREPLKPKIKLGWPLIKATITSVSLLFLTQNSFAQSSNKNIEVETIQTENRPLQLPVGNIDSIKVSGVIVDEEGSPIPGVYISQKGTQNLVLTDIDGKFTFLGELNIGDILVISFIGYESLEYKIRKETSSNVTLKLTLDQYVLMGEVAMEEIYKSEKSGIKNIWSKLKGVFSL